MGPQKARIRTVVPGNCRSHTERRPALPANSSQWTDYVNGGLELSCPYFQPSRCGHISSKTDKSSYTEGFAQGANGDQRLRIGGYARIGKVGYKTVLFRQDVFKSSLSSRMMTSRKKSYFPHWTLLSRNVEETQINSGGDVIHCTEGLRMLLPNQDYQDTLPFRLLHSFRRVGYQL